MHNVFLSYIVDKTPGGLNMCIILQMQFKYRCNDPTYPYATLPFFGFNLINTNEMFLI